MQLMTLNMVNMIGVYEQRDKQWLERLEQDRELLAGDTNKVHEMRTG